MGDRQNIRFPFDSANTMLSRASVAVTIAPEAAGFGKIGAKLFRLCPFESKVMYLKVPYLSFTSHSHSLQDKYNSSCDSQQDRRHGFEYMRTSSSNPLT